jgi:hypothetical protein
VVRNVTFSLPVDLLRKAKILAAPKDQSLNSLVREALERTADSDRRYQEAGRWLLEKARKPVFSIEPGSWKRDDLYDR